MLRIGIAVCMTAVTIPMMAQGPSRPRPMPPRPSLTADRAEGAVKEAMEQMGALRKIVDRDVEVLRHLRNAEDALADPMQPSNALQKAFEEIGAAKQLNPDFVVMQGILRVEKEVDAARRSPMTADFGRLRGLLRAEAIGPASRAAVRDALRLQDEASAWMRVQQLIGDHLKVVSDTLGSALRASEQ